MDAIFQEELEYTGEVDTAHWMEGSLVGAVVADLFNVVVYIYSEKKKDCKKIERGGKAKKQGDEVGKKSREDDEEYDCKPQTFVCCLF